VSQGKKRRKKGRRERGREIRKERKEVQVQKAQYVCV
jgi:hypothetical protein